MTDDTEPSTITPPREVLLFGTCLVDLLYPQAGLAAMRLLRQAGLRVGFPAGQTCCGQPAWNSGFRDHARRVARLQLDVLAGDAQVVVPSASCAGMFREHYPRMFAGTADEPRARQLAGRVVELCELLERLPGLDLTDRGPPLTVALHQSCSARRELGTAPAAARLLARLAHITVIEPDHATECCGFGGTFAVKQPEISAAMAADKATAIDATGAELLVSQDAGCLTNIGGTAAKAGLRLRVQHIAELLWQRTGGA